MFELIAIIFAVVGYAKLARQADQIKALEERVRSIQQTLSPFFGQPASGAAQTPASSASPAPVRSTTAPPQSPTSERSEKPPGAVRPGSPPPSERPAASFEPRRSGPAGREPLVDRLSAQTRQEWEALVGERLLNRVGAIALIIACGLFLKYAFDRDWISPAIRVLIGAALGTGLVFAASKQRERLPVFAQGLLGTGISVLYLSVYASFAFYELISVPVAFFLMSAVTVSAFERAVRFDSKGVGYLGWAGGYLTPLLLSNPVSGGPGADDPLALFIYLLLLQAGLLGLTLWRPDQWRVLEGLTLAGTYLTYLLWHTANYDPAQFWSATSFLVVVWGMFLAVDLRHTVTGETTDDPLPKILSSANGTIFYVLLFALVRSRYPGSLPAATMALGAAYALPLFVFRRPIALYALKAIALLALATSLQFDGFPLPVLWALEGLVLMAVGLKLDLRHIRLAALALFGLGATALVLTPDALWFRFMAEYNPIANERALSFGLLAGMLGAGAFAIERLGRQERDGRPTFEPEEDERGWAVPALQYTWAGMLLILLTVEINDFYRWRSDDRLAGLPRFSALLSIAAAWAGYSLLLVHQGIKRQSGALVQAGAGIGLLATLVALARGAAFVPLSEFQPLINIRAGVMAIVIVVLFLEARAIAGSQEDWAPAAAAGMGLGAALLIFALLTGEIRDFYRRSMVSAGAGEVERLQSQLQLALSAGWLFYASVALSLGFWLKKPGMRIAAIGLLGLTVLKVFLHDLSFLSQLYRIFSFMALGIILMAASYLYQRYREAIVGTG